MALIESLAMQKQIEQAQALESDLLAQCPSLSPCCRRHDLTLCCIDLAVEHHRSVVLLVRLGLYGTAAAVLRLLMEVVANAYWLSYAAGDDRIEALDTSYGLLLPDRERDLPTLSEALGDLKSEIPAIARLHEELQIKSKTGRARWLHSFTHGGTPQLVRRDVIEGWDELLVRYVLHMAGLLLVAAVELVAVIRNDEVLKTSVIDARERLIVAGVEAFGIEREPNQPLPVLSRPCSGAPLVRAMPTSGCR